MAITYIENKINPKDSMTWKKLYSAHQKLAPFSITLEDQPEPLVCEEIIRFLPRKRLLAFGKWNDQDVAIKLFYSRKKAKFEATRDAFGVEMLMQANVPTAKLLYKGSADKNRIYILIYEKIKHAESLETLWKHPSELYDTRELLHAVTIEIATQHVLGILQKDLHLNNFLITEKTIFTLDGGKIVFFEDPLTKHLSIKYLALFLAQFGVVAEDLQQELFSVYTKSRGWIVKTSDIKLFKKYLNQQTYRRMYNYKRKVFRSSTALKKIKSFHRTVIYDKHYESEEFKYLLSNPDHFINHKESSILKAGRSSTVAKISVDNKEFVIKRYNIKNIWHGLRRSLQMTRASNSWRIAHQVYASGIYTAKPIAIIENTPWGFHGKSYFIMEYIEGDHLGTYFIKNRDNYHACNDVAKKTFRLLKHLHKLRIIQGDLKMTNMLISNHNPYIIDFDGSKEYTSPLKLNYNFKKELKRFMKNWQNTPDIQQLFLSVMGNKLS